MRIVLDTNVVLDWLVFRDPGVARIAAFLEKGASATLLTNEQCEAELVRVLHYDNFALDDAARRTILDSFRSIAHRDTAVPSCEALPTCKDPDDQKFLELARDARADYLVTKDKALLTLGRKRYGIRAFAIVTPGRFPDVTGALQR
ncbi:MAG: putative toxin-antitoxin system toxin component, PIN family [Burkholderiales bacterium]